jgi:hypothetical protein
MNKLYKKISSLGCGYFILAASTPALFASAGGLFRFPTMGNRFQNGLTLPRGKLLEHLQGFKVNDASSFGNALCGYSALWAACRINGINPAIGGNITVSRDEVCRFAGELDEALRPYGIFIGAPLDVNHLGPIAEILGYHIILEVETPQHNTYEFNTSAPGEPFRLYLSVTPNGGHYQILIPTTRTVH